MGLLRIVNKFYDLLSDGNSCQQLEGLRIIEKQSHHFSRPLELDR